MCVKRAKEAARRFPPLILGDPSSCHLRCCFDFIFVSENILIASRRDFSRFCQHARKTAMNWLPRFFRCSDSYQAQCANRQFLWASKQTRLITNSPRTSFVCRAKCKTPNAFLKSAIEVQTADGCTANV